MSDSDGTDTTLTVSDSSSTTTTVSVDSSNHSSLISPEFHSTDTESSGSDVTVPADYFEDSDIISVDGPLSPRSDAGSMNLSDIQVGPGSPIGGRVPMLFAATERYANLTIDPEPHTPLAKQTMAADDDSDPESAGEGSTLSGSSDASLFAQSDHTGVVGFIQRFRLSTYEIIYLVVKGNTFLTPLMVCLTLIDFIQLVSYALDPGPFSSNSTVFNRTMISLLQMTRLVPAADTMTSTHLYLTATGITVTLAALFLVCMYMRRQLSFNKIPPIVLIRAIRLLISFVVTVAFIPIVTIYIRVIILSLYPLPSTILTLDVGIACLAIVTLSVVIVMLASANLIFFQPDLVTPHFLTKLHARVDVMNLLLKVVIIVVYNLYTTIGALEPKFGMFGDLSAMIFMVSAIAYIVFQPYTRRVSNAVRSTMFTVLAAICTAHHGSLGTGASGLMMDVSIVSAGLLALAITPPVTPIVCLGMSWTVRRFLASLSPASPDAPPASMAAVADEAGAINRPIWLFSYQVEPSVRFIAHKIRKIQRQIVKETKKQPMSMPGYEADVEPIDLTELEAEKELLVDQLYRVFQHAFRRYPNSLFVCSAYFAYVAAFRPVCVTDCSRRAAKMREAGAGERWDTLYYFFQATRARGQGGNNDEIARLERQRRLKSTIKDQRALQQDRKAFWTEIAAMKQRSVTPMKLNALYSITARMSVTIERVNTNYVSLLSRATPRILRQYAVFLRDTMGLGDDAKAYLEQADELEAAGRDTVAVQACDALRSDKGQLMGLVQTTLELKAIACVGMLAGIIAAMGGMLYVIVKVVFEHILALFFAFTMLTFGTQLSIGGAVSFAETGDPSLLMGFEQQTQQLLSAILNTADKPHLTNVFDTFVSGMVLAAPQEAVPDAARAAVVANLTTVPWSTSSFYPHSITQYAVSLFTTHVKDFGLTNIDVMTNTSLEFGLTMVGDQYWPGEEVVLPAGVSMYQTKVVQAMSTLLTVVSTISDINKARLVAKYIDGDPTAIYPTNPEDDNGPLGFILANGPRVMAALNELMTGLLVSCHTFPFTLAVFIFSTCIAFVGITIVALTVVYLRPVRQSYNETLDLVKVFVMLPSSVSRAFINIDKKDRPVRSKQRKAVIQFALPDDAGRAPSSPTSTVDPHTPTDSIASTPLPDASNPGHRDTAAMARWRRTRPMLLRTQLLHLLPRVIGYVLATVAVFDLFSGVMFIRIIESSKIATEAFITTRGLLSNRDVIEQLQRIGMHETGGTTAADLASLNRVALGAQLETLDDIMAWFASSTATAGHNYIQNEVPGTVAETWALFMTKYLTPPAWITGGGGDTIMAVLHTPHCPMAFVSPDLCLKVMYGGKITARAQTMSGLLGSLTYSMAVGTSALSSPVGTVKGLADELTKVDLYGASSYLITVSNLLQDRLTSTTTETVNIIFGFSAVLILLLVVMYFRFYRPVAITAHRRYTELAVNLDAVLRIHGSVLSDELKGIIEHLRPAVMDDINNTDEHVME